MQAPVTAHGLLRNSKNKDGLKDRMEENSFTSMEDKSLWSRSLDFSTFIPPHPLFKNIL